MYLKIHESTAGRIIAVCDADILGKKFQEGEAMLDLEKFKGFYAGKKCNEKEVADTMKHFTSANVVGKKAVAIFIENGYASKEDIKSINGVPYIQVYKI